MDPFDEVKKFCVPHGSRYHGCNRPDSDYDFLAEDTAANHSTLKSLGFVYHRWPNSCNNPHHGGNYYLSYDNKLLDVTMTGNLKSDLIVRDYFATVLNHIAKDKRDYLYAAVAEIFNSQRLKIKMM